MLTWRSASSRAKSPDPPVGSPTWPHRCTPRPEPWFGTAIVGTLHTFFAVGQGFLATGVLVAVVATGTGGAEAPFAGSAREALAILLLAGWIGLTVAGALLHLLAVLAGVRRFPARTAASRPARDRLVAAMAGVGVGALALSTVSGLDPLADPATAGILLVAVFVGGRILTLAASALRIVVTRPT